MNITRLKKATNPFYLYRNRQKILPYTKTQIRNFESSIAQSMRNHGLPYSKNDWRLFALKNKHEGQRCFIIGNGPSLKIEDLDRLKNDITFASNKIYLAFDQTDWRPCYYSVCDILVAEYNCETINTLSLTKIFDNGIRKFFPDEHDIIYTTDRWKPIVDGEPAVNFSKNLLLGTYSGWTIIFQQLQLALWMGIREVYLIGTDFSFQESKRTGEKTSCGDLILEQDNEQNHFHPDYRKPGEKWTLPQLNNQYKAFLCAKTTFESENGFIANASRQTALDLFPLVHFDDIAQIP